MYILKTSKLCYLPKPVLSFVIKEVTKTITGSWHRDAAIQSLQNQKCAAKLMLPLVAQHFDGLVQKRRNFSALAVELRLYRTYPSISCQGVP